MRVLRYKMILVAAFALVGALGARSAAGADVLYIGDGGDSNAIKRFDASSGTRCEGTPS